jgi:hypothetical protein
MEKAKEIIKMIRREKEFTSEYVKSDPEVRTEEVLNNFVNKIIFEIKMIAGVD